MTSLPQISHPLVGAIEHMIRESDAALFPSLALKLFHFQFENNLPYRKYATALGCTTDTVQDWKDAPAVPTRAFKLPAHPLTCFPDGPVAARFLTSGTTTEIKGEHLFPCTKLYEHSIRETVRQAGLPDLAQLHFLAPSPGEAPHSSLSPMFGTLAKEDSQYLLVDSKFDLTPLYKKKEPLFLMGTALAFLHLMESHQRIALPPGSHLLETGGYKGTARVLEKRELYEQLSDFFEVPQEQIHNEYGMTELSTQAYATGPEGAHRFPAWCKARIICPETSQELPAGEPGYLQIFDLANAYTVAAIQTQDFAIANANGSFHLMGRDPSALPRGCSRSIDESLTS